MRKLLISLSLLLVSGGVALAQDNTTVAVNATASGIELTGASGEVTVSDLTGAVVADGVFADGDVIAVEDGTYVVTVATGDDTAAAATKKGTTKRPKQEDEEDKVLPQRKSLKTNIQVEVIAVELGFE